MDARELISEVRRLEIRTRMVVDEVVGGAYRSRFKGRGIEFDEVREYVPGDDVRDIDWNVTARMGAPFVKKYVEERELHVLLAVDVSASGLFGSGAKTKIRTQAEIAALLALSAVRNHDKVGMVTFSDRIESVLPMRSGRGHVLRMLRDLVATEPLGRATDLAFALDKIRKSQKKRAVIFLISDFLDARERWSENLRMLSRRHDLVMICVSDPAEAEWGVSGIWNVADAENLSAGTFRATKKFRENFAANFRREREELEAEAARANAGFIPLVCGEDVVPPMMRFFAKRRSR